MTSFFKAKTGLNTFKFQVSRLLLHLSFFPPKNHQGPEINFEKAVLLTAFFLSYSLRFLSLLLWMLLMVMTHSAYTTCACLPEDSFCRECHLRDVNYLQFFKAMTHSLILTMHAHLWAFLKKCVAVCVWQF